jgi:putative ABC transport system substrate-binding protein
MLRRRAAVGLMLAPMAGIGAHSFAQQAGGARLIGLLRLGSQTSESPWLDAFRQGLKENGLVENSDVRLIARYANNQPERLVDLARELVNERCQLIVATGTTSVSAAQKAAPDTPIVMAGSADPVEMGFARSLARPGGRITGISVYGAELVAKQLQILQEAVPSAHTVAAFLQAGNPGNAVIRQNLENGARNTGLRVAIHEIEGVDRFAAAFEWARQQAAQAVYVITDPVFIAHSRTIFQLAIDHRLPTMTGTLSSVRAGALLAYSIDINAIARRTGYYIKEILRGIDPGTLPIEQPTEVTLAVNLATARVLGIQLPNALLLRATIIVE